MITPEPRASVDAQPCLPRRPPPARRRADPDADATELAELLVRVAGGDTDVFAEFYDRTFARVYRAVLRVLRDAGFAEGTTQEVFAQIWCTADTFDPGKGSALSWLLTPGTRPGRRPGPTEQAESDRRIAYAVRNQPGQFDPVTEQVLDSIEHDAVRDYLTVLTAVQRESVTLAYYGGLTYRQVAAHLGVAVPTVKSRIREGLIRCREQLSVR